MGVLTPTPLGWCLGVASRAAPGPPAGPVCSPLATLHRAKPSLLTKHLSLLLAIPRGQCIWRAVGCVITAPVNVLVEASQHSTPWAVSWKLGLQAHQQCLIIDCPHEVLKMVGIVHIPQGQGIRHTLLLRPHATTQCTAVWRGTKSHRLLRASCPCLTAASPGQTRKIAHQEHITASWAGIHHATHPCCAGCPVAWWGS